MLSYLNGLVKECQKNDYNSEMILAVGSEAHGFVGYQVKTPDHPRYDVYIKGARAEVYIYSHVREDAFDLYGFLNATEKLLFTTLLSVSGVGPKMALALLSFTDAAALIQMILDEDKVALTSISGVGKKTAERIILELKDNIRKKVEANIFVINTKSNAQMGEVLVNRASNIFVESYLALQSLGYKELQARQMVEKVLSEKPQSKVEEVIKNALQVTL